VSTGRLYQSLDGKFIAEVNYTFQHEEEHRWWGELTLVDYVRVKDGGGYIIELEDGRRGECFIKKIVNRVMPTVPPIYNYYFRGSGRLEKPE